MFEKRNIIPTIIFHGTTSERLKKWTKKDGSIISEFDELWFSTENDFALGWAKKYSKEERNGDPILIFVLSRMVENLRFNDPNDANGKFLRGKKILPNSYVVYNLKKDRLNLYNGKLEIREQIRLLIKLCKPLGAYPDYVYVFANHLGIEIK